MSQDFFGGADNIANDIGGRKNVADAGSTHPGQKRNEGDVLPGLGGGKLGAHGVKSGP